VKIKKKNGELQEYDREKLERSIQNAGGSIEISRIVSGRMLPLEGLNSSDLRRRVGEELNRENPALSGAYLSTKSLTARSDPNLAQGAAGLNTEHMVGLKVETMATLFSANGRAEVRLQPLPKVDRRVIHLNTADMDKLKVSDGSRVRIRYPMT
jgi:predicted transcriptional regulator with HTH domain